MNKFNKKIDELRCALDDIIIHLENMGRVDKKIKLVRSQLDNIDPFIRVDSAIAAESIIMQNKLCNSH